MGKVPRSLAIVIGSIHYVGRVPRCMAIIIGSTHYVGRVPRCMAIIIGTTHYVGRVPRHMAIIIGSISYVGMTPGKEGGCGIDSACFDLLLWKCLLLVFVDEVLICRLGLKVRLANRIVI